MSSQSIPILVSGKSFLLKEGIGALVDTLPGYHIIQQVNGALFEAVSETNPQLVIYEFDATDRNLYDTVDKILNSTNAKVLLIAGEVKREKMQKLVKKGVKCIVTSQCSQDEITNAITTAAKGERFMCSKVLDVLMNETVEQQSIANNLDRQSLSPREREVLTLITQGYTTIQIADTLHVSIHTINSHRKNMLKKFNLKSPIELIVFALENNLVDK